MPACRTGDQMHGIFHDLFAVCQNNLSGGCDKNMVKAVVAAVFAAGNDPPAHFFCPSVNHFCSVSLLFFQLFGCRFGTVAPIGADGTVDGGSRLGNGLLFVE